MIKGRYFYIVALGILLLIIPFALSTDLLYIEKITPRPGYPINITGETVFTQNVGIGTSSHNSKLEVYKGLQSDTISVANSAAYIRGHDVGLAIGQSSSSPWGTWLQSIRTYDNVIFPLALNPAGGNVGIGTTTPEAKLDVNGNLLLQYGTAINEFSTDTTLAGNSDLAVPTEKAIKTYVDAQAGSGLTGTGSANYITKWTGTTSVGNSVIYESGGNIGIGTTSPGAKLDTRGNTVVTGRLQIGNADATWINDVITGAADGIKGADAVLFVPVYTGTESSDLRLYITDNDDDKFSVWAGTCAGGDCGNLSVASEVAEFSYGKTAFGLTSNVGIGTTSPSYKLHVNGTFYADTVNTGQGANELYAMNQNVRTTDAVTFATINTGIGATEVYLMNQNVRTTDSLTFADITISGVESNNIYTVDYPNSAITTNSPSSLASIRTALRFNWYATDWEIGNIRGSSTDTQGFGIATNNGTNLRWRVTDGTTYDYNNLQVSGSLTASTLNTGYGDKELGDASVADGDTNSIPTNDQVYDFVTGYVGSGGSGDIYVNEAGDNMTGDLDMNDNELFAADFVHSNAISIADTYSNGVSNRPPGYSMYVQDDIHVGGDITGVGADVAEYFYSEGGVEAGDVVVIFSDIGVKKSEEAYDTKVAGIVSTDPQYLMATDREGVPIAVAGTTPVKISVENGEINYGDLLTTSTKPGHAMKCKDTSLCRGAIVGKALQKATSDGVIVALVMLG